MVYTYLTSTQIKQNPTIGLMFKQERERRNFLPRFAIQWVFEYFGIGEVEESGWDCGDGEVLLGFGVLWELECHLERSEALECGIRSPTYIWRVWGKEEEDEDFQIDFSTLISHGSPTVTPRGNRLGLKDVAACRWCSTLTTNIFPLYPIFWTRVSNHRSTYRHRILYHF